MRVGEGKLGRRWMEIREIMRGEKSGSREGAAGEVEEGKKDIIGGAERK